MEFPSVSSSTMGGTVSEASPIMIGEAKQKPVPKNDKNTRVNFILVLGLSENNANYLYPVTGFGMIQDARL